MAQRITANDLIDNIRQQLDEDNTAAVSDSTDILPAMNRAQNFALDILARVHPESLLTNSIITTSSGEDTYDIPEDAFEQRLLKVEVSRAGLFTELTAISYLDASLYENSQDRSSNPYYYCIVGNQFKVFPVPAGSINLRLWYLKDPQPLIKSQGRINILNTGSNYVIVDTIGEDISTTADDLESFVSIIDGASGVRKGTFQVQAISGNKITFKTVPTRTTVLDIPVDTALSGLELTPSQDDYVCLATGNCVPFFKKPLSNFIIEYSVAELTRKLGGDAGLEEQVLRKFEEQVTKTWAKRPNALRVRKRNDAWSVPTRRISIGN